MRIELPRLGVNIDHVATLRQLRGTPYPSVEEAARLAILGGATQITVHLREDRRHIQDQDVFELRKALPVPLNLEMSVAKEIVSIALKVKPAWVCLVPEKREEVTTEGGLNVSALEATLQKLIGDFHAKKSKVSLFIEPELSAVRVSKRVGADAIEIHTGKYCRLAQSTPRKGLQKLILEELKKIETAAREGRKLGLSVHVGHGLDAENVRPITEWKDSAGAPLIAEYNIGHSIVARSVFVGFERAVREMHSAIVAP